MLIKDLIICLNNQLPTLEEVKVKFRRLNIDIDEAKAAMHRESLKVVYNEDVVLSANDPVTEMIGRTNINIVGVGSINIYSLVEINEDENLIEFASYNDFFRICFSTINRSVVLFSDEGDEKEIITPHIEDFLEFLCEYNKYNKSVVYGVEYNKELFINNLNKLINQGFSRKFINELINT